MMDYKNPIPVAVAILRLADRIVVIKRGIEPCIGGWALPGGYVDEGETAEQACAREVHEELGLHSEPSAWKLIGSEITPNNRLLLFLTHDVETGDPLLPQRIRPRSPEVLDWTFMDRLAEPLCFPLHHKRAVQVARS